MRNNKVCGPDCKGCKNCGRCSCSHHLAIPLIIILLGLVFLLGAEGFMSFEGVSLIWPMLVILLGIVKLVERDCDCC